MLRVAGLEAAYGSSQVLFGIDFEVNAGEVVTLMGRNGMGKTTTVNTIMGLVGAGGLGLTFHRQLVMYNYGGVTTVIDFEPKRGLDDFPKVRDIMTEILEKK